MTVTILPASFGLWCVLDARGVVVMSGFSCRDSARHWALAKGYDVNPDPGLFYCHAQCVACSGSEQACGYFPDRGWVCWRCASTIITTDGDTE